MHTRVSLPQALNTAVATCRLLRALSSERNLNIPKRSSKHRNPKIPLGLRAWPWGRWSKPGIFGKVECAVAASGGIGLGLNCGRVSVPVIRRTEQFSNRSTICMNSTDGKVAKKGNLKTTGGGTAIAGTGATIASCGCCCCCGCGCRCGCGCGCCCCCCCCCCC